MRILLLDHVQEGMKVAKSIYGANGEILLAAGIQLTSRYIQRLRDLGIVAVYVEGEKTEDIEINDVIAESTRAEAIKVTQDFMKRITLNPDVDKGQIMEVVDSIINELLANKNLLINMIEIRAMNDHTFGHSVNVAILSIITGIAMGYDHQKLRKLALGALFHDIGKIKLPEYLLLKNEPLTQDEEELWMNHAKDGFDLLGQLEGVDLTSAHVAFQHHERYDGSGYPRQIKGDKIHEFARIVSVCNVYDRLTTKQLGHRHCLPFQAMEILIGNSGKFFAPEVVRHFMKYIAVFPIGTRVVLNNREEGIVVETQKEYPTRPTVRIVRDSEGKEIIPYYDVNLVNHPEICIIRVEEEG